MRQMQDWEEHIDIRFEAWCCFYCLAHASRKASHRMRTTGAAEAASFSCSEARSLLYSANGSSCSDPLGLPRTTSWLQLLLGQPEVLCGS